MTSKLVVNTIEADTGISSVSFASSISMSSTSKFHFGNAGIDIGADTNINRPSAGVLGFNINSSEKVRITSAGKVGIGTNVGLSDILTVNDTNPKISMRDGGVERAFLHVDSSDDFIVNNKSISNLIFKTQDAERLRITSAGNIGVGNDGSFPIYTDTNDRNFIIGTGSDDTAIQIHSGSDKYGGVYFGDATSGGDRYRGYVEFKHGTSDDYLRFAAGGGEKLRITSAGYLKLGSTDGGAWHTIRLNTTTNNAIKDVLNIHSSVDGATAAAGFGVRLNFFGEQLNGNEYIYGSIAGLLSSTGSNYGDLAFYTNNNGTNTERLRIQSNGIVKVESNDSSGLSAHLVVNNSQSNSGLSIMGSGGSFSSGGWAAVTDAGIIRSSANSSNGLVLQAASGDMRFYAGGNPPAERMRITSSGYTQTFNNPSFRAGLNSNTSFNSSTDIIFNDTSSTWHYNRGGHYNTGNGRFTAPVTGVYQFNACVIWYGAPNNTFMGDAFHYYVNGGLASYSGRRGYYNTGTTGNSLYYTDHMSVNLYLNATDYITIRQSSPVVTVHGNTYYTWFAGSFLG